MTFEPIDAGMALWDAAMSAGPVVLPSPDSDPGNFFARAFAAFNDRNWRYLAALTVIGAVFLIRKAFAAKIVKLQEGRWAWTVAVVGSGLAALATFLASDLPATMWGVVGAFLSGAFVGLAGAGAVKGVYEWQRKPPVHNEPVVETMPPPGSTMTPSGLAMPLAAPSEEHKVAQSPPPVPKPRR